MIKIAIRDDDLNFFSKVSDLESIYDDLKDFPVSFAVIPNVKDVSTKGACSDTIGNLTPRWIGDNKDLTNWLRERTKKRKADILMHGITHEYHFIRNKRLAEMQWREEIDLANIIAFQKKKLEELFNYQIGVFVAPSNKISRYGIQCIAKNRMNYSGIVPINFQRDYTVINLFNYIKRWGLRVKDGLPYPNILKYSDHKEINACAMQGYNYLVKMFNYCERINSPMVINVHYWHLRDEENIRKQLIQFIDYALKHDATPSTVSEILS